MLTKIKRNHITYAMYSLPKAVEKIVPSDLFFSVDLFSLELH